MEIQKLKKARMQAVKVISLSFIILCLACSGKKNLAVNNDKYKIDNYTSNDGSTYLALRFYHYENKEKRAPAFFYINNLIYDPKNKLKDTVLYVLPGYFNIKANYVSKDATEINKLQIKKGDSIAIKIYLKDTSELLNNNEQ